MQETWVRSLGQEDTLGKEMATHSSLLAGKSHAQKSLAGHSLCGCKELDMIEGLTLSLSLFLPSISWVLVLILKSLHIL